MAGLIINLLIMAMEIANISSKIKQMIYLEIVYDAIWILFYLIAANIIIKFVKYDGIVGVSVFCGYVALITYILDLLWKLKKLKNPDTSSASNGNNAGTEWNSQ